MKLILLIAVAALSACVSVNQQPASPSQENLSSGQENLPSALVSNDLRDICSGIIRENVTHTMSFDFPVWQTPVKYFVDSSNFNGSEYRLNLSLSGFYEAIRYLENMTNGSLSFEMSGSPPDVGIVVYSYESLAAIGEPDAKGLSVVTSYIPAGSSGNTSPLGDSSRTSPLGDSQSCTRILSGELYVTPSYSCSNFVISLHETAHLLGFGHSNNTNSIMYAYGPACSSKPDSSFVQTLNALYP